MALESVPRAELDDYLDHIDYVVRRIGVEHVGIGTDFDHGAGIVGFKDTSEARNLTRGLLLRGYSDATSQRSGAAISCGCCERPRQPPRADRAPLETRRRDSREIPRHTAAVSLDNIENSPMPSPHVTESPAGRRPSTASTKSSSSAAARPGSRRRSPRGAPGAPRSASSATGSAAAPARPRAEHLLRPARRVHGEHRQIVHGLADDILARLERMDGLNKPHLTIQNQILAQAYDISAYKIAADELLAEASVHMLFHAFARASSWPTTQRIDAVLVETKSGRCAVRGQMFIDGSGDGDLAAWAGAPYEVGDGAGKCSIRRRCSASTAWIP